MTRRVRAALTAFASLTALAALAATPAAATATYAGTLAIDPVVTPRDSVAPIAVTAQATLSRDCDAGTFCGWYPFVTTVAAAKQCTPRAPAVRWVGEPVDDAAGRQPQTVAPGWTEELARAAADKRACLYASDGKTNTLVAEATFTVPAVPKPDPRGRDLVRAAIPRSVGTRRGYGYRLSMAGIPRAIGAQRFRALTRVAARRWGLRYVGVTNRPARPGDGRNTVGFSRRVPRGALGVTRIRSVRYYRRGPDGRPVHLHTRVLERDLQLSVRVAWHPGPGTPPRDRVDLQTVLIHELGHYAGNDHVPNCTNSPMWLGLRPGEWWWSRSNWFQFGCGATASSRGAGAAGGRRPLLVQRTVERIVIA